MNDMFYSSYKYNMVKFDGEKKEFTVYNEKYSATATMLLKELRAHDSVISFADTEVTVSHNLERETHNMTVTFKNKESGLRCAQITVFVNSRDVKFAFREIGHYYVMAEGLIHYGNPDKIFAIDTRNTPTNCIRAAIGPASSKYDNAVYNVENDTAFAIEGIRTLDMCYNHREGCFGYTFAANSDGGAGYVTFSIKKDLVADRYNIDFVPLKKRKPYNAPPAGFMTWYSLKFNTCEQTLLENVEFQRKNLKDYGADTVWVDWEWCHRRYERERFDGVDNFNPDPEKYPNGLGFISKKIKEAGFVPALWLGFTNDIALTDYEREHPEISLSHHDTWSGRYYYDLTHPEYLDGYLVKAVNQVKEWGFEAVKYDTLPNCITAHELYHQNMLHPEVTTYSAFRGMIEKTREILGEDFYMLSCGSAEEVILWGTGVFDAARVGPDLFTWEEFCTTIGRIRRYYALHGIVAYNDPDCLVLREAFSNIEQARSRLSIVSLLGMPVNFGDELTKLPEDRIELIRRALPVLNTHTKHIGEIATDGKTQIITLDIELPFESYTVVGVMNLTDKNSVCDLDFDSTLRLRDGEYLIYDFFEKKFLGIHKGGITVDILPYDTKVLAIRKMSGVPQIVSTSRHLTQGAAEIKSSVWCDKDYSLTIECSLVKNDPYTLTCFIPNEYEFDCANYGASVNNNILSVSHTVAENGDCTFKLKFKKR